MNSYYEIIYEFMLWIHEWIQCYEEFREIIAEFLK